MIPFKFFQQDAVLVWYRQELVTAALDRGYGQEILCRGFILPEKASEKARMIPMSSLLPYLLNNKPLLLQMTCQQILDTSTLPDIGAPEPENNASAGKVSQRPQHCSSHWINLAGPLIADDTLFNTLWYEVLLALTESQKQKLVLEICEHDTDDDLVYDRVNQLKAQGFTTAMDDFGSGYSNLLRLNQSPFDIIKLDLQLLRQVPDNLWSASFYREIVNLCASKGSLIVAEGVETELQSDFVRWAGTDLIQGYLYSRPEPLFPERLPDSSVLLSDTIINK